MVNCYDVKQNTIKGFFLYYNLVHLKGRCLHQILGCNPCLHYHSFTRSCSLQLFVFMWKALCLQLGFEIWLKNGGNLKMRKVTFCKNVNGSKERRWKVFWYIVILVYYHSKPLKIVVNGYNIWHHESLCDFTKHDNSA